MKCIFYDRKNKREVSNEELSWTRLIQEIAVGDSQDDTVPTGRRICPKTSDTMTAEQFLKYYERRDQPLDLDVWMSWQEEKTPRVLHLREELIADLCYKSEECPSYCNWDLHTTINDLVFLRFE